MQIKRATSPLTLDFLFLRFDRLLTIEFSFFLMNSCSLWGFVLWWKSHHASSLDVPSVFRVALFWEWPGLSSIRLPTSAHQQVSHQVVQHQKPRRSSIARSRAWIYCIFLYRSTGLTGSFDSRVRWTSSPAVGAHQPATLAASSIFIPKIQLCFLLFLLLFILNRQESKKKEKK